MAQDTEEHWLITRMTGGWTSGIPNWPDVQTLDSGWEPFAFDEHTIGVLLRKRVHIELQPTGSEVD